MIDASILFLTASDPCIAHLRPYGIAYGPITDFETSFVVPLRSVFSRVSVYDLWQEYAKHGLAKANRRVLDIVRSTKPKYLIWPTMAYELIPSTLENIRNEGTFVVGWFFDDEFRFDNYSRLWTPYLHFCFTNDPSAVQKYQDLGVPAIHLLLKSHPNVFQKLNVPFRYDVSFVGRQFGDRRDLIDFLLYRGINVETFGKGWENGWVSTEDYVRIVNETKINLCFTKGCGTSKQPQMKGMMFHICMAGGFLLCEYLPGIEDNFEIGREIVCFSNIEEARDKIQYFLNHDQERDSIALAGFNRARKDHSLSASLTVAFQKIEQVFQNERNDLVVKMLTTEDLRLPRQLACNYHLSWARALIAEGYPVDRWTAELDAAIDYDPANPQARWMRRFIFLPREIRTAIMKLIILPIRLRRSIAKVPWLRKFYHFIRSFIGKQKHLELG